MKKLFAVFAIFLFTMPSLAEETKFMRVVRNSDGVPLAFDTATVRYVKGDITVDLIGVVHIGDTIYYQRFNQQFKQYESLLYELVAPPGVVPEKQKPGSFDLQQLIGLILQLDFQKGVIDYRAPNFVHADLSMEGIKKAVAARGEDGITIILGIARDLLIRNNMSKLQKATGVSETDMRKFQHKDNAVYFKRIMAHSMGTNADAAALGQTIGNILIDDRNKAAMKVLRKEMIVGGKKKLGLFYGAAHMPDFEQRLLKMGFKKQNQTWQRAWDIRPKGPEFMLRMMMQQLQQQK